MPPGPALEIAFLGSGNAFTTGRYWNSFLLNGRYLFEAPPTVVAHLKKMEVPLEDIATVFISHFHGDHFYGLPFLLLEYAHLTQRTDDLTIVGPPGIEERVEVVTQVGFPHLTRKEAGYRLRYREVHGGREERLPGAGDAGSFTAVRVEHVTDFECYGYRVHLGDRVLAYSGDAVLCDALVDLAEGADAFIVECSCWEGTCGPHLTLRDIVELRKQISPRTTFILTHMDAGEGNLRGLDSILGAEDFGVYRL